jgi:hypothetical protein
MSTDHKRKLEKLAKIPLTLEAYLAGLEPPQSEEVEALFQVALAEAHHLEVMDLWESRDLAATYWILMISGVNQPEEMDIATNLLSWKAFFAKDSAMVACIQSSERNEFRCASSKFGVVNCPALILGDSPEMNSFIEIRSELLFTLASNKGSFQRFVTRLHQLIENGTSIEDLRALLWSEQFWSGIKVVYSEVKSVVASTVKANIELK